MSKNIEVEARTFISDLQFEAIKAVLDKKCKPGKKLKEVTVYFSGEKDLRMRKDETGAFVILKEGDIHDDFRKEYEVGIGREDFDDMKEIFESLGYEIEIEWRRDRLVYSKGSKKILLDDTEGYGKILEMEEMAEEGEEKEVYGRLLEEMNGLGISEMTPKEEFNQRFEYYKNNWKNLIR